MIYHYQDVEKSISRHFENINLVDSGSKDGTDGLVTLDKVDNQGLDFQIEDK